MLKFPVALQIYSVRDDAEKDFRGTLKKVADMGYDGVEFAGLYGHTAEEVRSICEETGLVPISAHVPYDALSGDTAATLKVYSDIGCKYIAIPYLTPEYRPGSGRFDEVIANAAVIGKAAKALGMQLLYHNHDFEFAKVDGKYALDILYDSVPEEYLKTELDTCWVNVGGEDPVKYLRKYAGRAPVVHLKDFTGVKSENMYALIGIDDKKQAEEIEDDKFSFRPVGYGKQDIPSILIASEKAGAEWVVVEQDMPSLGKTPMECAEMSIKYLRTL